MGWGRRDDDGIAWLTPKGPEWHAAHSPLLPLAGRILAYMPA
jgi:hypothetical protein